MLQAKLNKKKFFKKFQNSYVFSMLNTVERRLFKLIETRGGSDNQTTCNIWKIYHLNYSNMQYCITNYENTSFTVHIHSDLLYRPIIN